MKLTQWFPGDVKPVHIGVYERRLKFKTYVYYSRWNGERWQWLHWTVEDAAASAGAPSVYQNLPWRGVLK